MGKHVTTRSENAIRAYYRNHKCQLLRLSKKDAEIDNVNNYLSDVGIDNSSCANKEENIKDGSSVDIDGVVVGDKLTTFDIMLGAKEREDITNTSVSLATNEDLINFLHSFFVELKEQLQTNEKNVRVANIGTFSQIENGQLMITNQP